MMFVMVCFYEARRNVMKMVSSVKMMVMAAIAVIAALIITTCGGGGSGSISRDTETLTFKVMDLTE